MAGLPEDIITDILRRLPAKPLARFKLVSKQWRWLISTPEFIRSHLQEMLHGPMSCTRILVLGNPLRSVSIELLCDDAGFHSIPTTEVGMPNISHEKEKVSGISVVGSSHGLVCLHVKYCRAYGSFYLLNPTTREFRELPSPEVTPSDAGIFFGLGFDFQSRGYKFVRGHRKARRDVSDSYGCTCVQIFSLATNCWRMISVEGAYFRSTSTSFGVYANGSLHWLARGGSEPTGRLISFDLSGEKLHEMVPMAGIHYYENHPLEGIGVSGQRLFAYRGCQSGTHFEVWLMNLDSKESQWIKLCSVPVDEYSPFAYYNVRPISLMRDGKIVMARCCSELCRYDPKEDTIKMLKLDEAMKVFGFATYVESLVSPRDKYSSPFPSI